MSLAVRKLIIIGLIAAVLLLANAWAIVSWLGESGLIGLAQHIRAEWFTGTAVAVIAVLLFLLRPAAQHIVAGARRCPVCDEVLRREGKYCPACGSRV